MFTLSREEFGNSDAVAVNMRKDDDRKRRRSKGSFTASLPLLTCTQFEPGLSYRKTFDPGIFLATGTTCWVNIPANLYDPKHPGVKSAVMHCGGAASVQSPPPQTTKKLRPFHPES